LKNPQIEHPQIENPQNKNPQIENPQIENPQIENSQILGLWRNCKKAPFRTHPNSYTVTKKIPGYSLF
jgi:hypothetical protein